jgi:hypothetical protein
MIATLRMMAIVMSLATGWVLTSTIGVLVFIPLPLALIMTVCFAGAAWLVAGMLADRQVERESRKDDNNDLP